MKGLTASQTVPTAKGINSPGEGFKETNNKDLEETNSTTKLECWLPSLRRVPRRSLYAA